MTSLHGIRIAAAPAAAALLLLVGCGGAVGAARRSPGVVEKDAFQPTRPVATNYGPDPSFTCPERGVNGMIDGDVASVNAKPDGRLCAVAETLLGWEGTDTPPANVMAVLSSDFGLPLTIRRVVITTMQTAEESSKGTNPSGAQPREVADRLVEPIKSFASTATVPRYGVVVERIKRGLSKLVLVMQDQPFEMKPLPRKLSPGQTATFSGTLLGNLTNAKVQYTDAVGKLERAETQGGKSFSVPLKCGDKPGRIVVQAAGEQEGADVLLASFPVACGTELPIAAAIPKAGGPAAGTMDPKQGEKVIADLINQERTQAGLKPLAVDPDLSNVARSLADDRGKGKGITSDAVQTRLKEADISAPVILLSEGQAMGAEDAHARFSNSPQDRANEMNSDVTQIGIGIAPGPKVGDQPSIVVTELFLKQLPPPDPDEVRTKLYQAISRRRSEARAGSVAKDPQLEQIAQAYASELAKEKGKVPKEKAAAIEAPLYKAFATVNEIGGVKADPLEFAEEPGVVGDAKLVGVGVGVGSSPQFGKNSAYVVILMGKKHTKAPPAAKQQPVKKR
jgi:uncharacterized protein YkwD